MSANRLILFLCVANSARSQMAEGLAREMAPEGFAVASAGSDPTAVRPEAVAVLREMGIDIAGHRSKNVTEFGDAAVDTVITLCAEEVCPAYFNARRRLHWPLPDPAAEAGDQSQRLEAFRAVRAELSRRLDDFFATDPAQSGTD